MGVKLTFLIILIGLAVAGGVVMVSARSAAQSDKGASVSTVSVNEAVAVYLETHMDSFGYKTSWIALKAESPAQVITALELNDVKAIDWNEGVALGYANQDVQAKRLFVSGVVDGWHFIQGAIPDPTADLAKFEKLMSKLASVSDDVQYFISNRISDGYGWVRYRNGKLIRRIIWYNGEPRFEFGKLDQVESQIVQSWEVFNDGGDPYTIGPDEDDVLKIAASWSVDPSSFDRLKSEVPVGLVGKQTD